MKRHPARIFWFGFAVFLPFSAALSVVFANRIRDGLQADASAALQAKGLDWAHVRMAGQAALITGQAPSPVDHQLAVDTVATAHGEGGWFLGGVTQVIDQITALPHVSPFVWVAERGPAPRKQVRFAGSVTTRRARLALRNYGQALFGAEIADETTLGMGAPRGDWTDVVQTGLAQMAYLDNGRVELRDYSLTVSGIAPDVKTATAVRAALAALPSPFQGHAEISVAAPRAR